MKTIVIKRNLEEVPFNEEKIEKAVMKSFKSLEESYQLKSNTISTLSEEKQREYSKAIALSALVKMREKEKVTIAEIEAFVFDELCRHNLMDVARAYEGYRSIQAFKREVNTTDDGILSLLEKKNKDLMEENSNKNSALASTQRDLIAGEVSKDIVRRKMLPLHLLQAHDKGSIHIHDMDYMVQPIINCCLINLEDMLNNGTVVNEKKIEKPKSFQTACTITTQIIAQVASNQYGGQSITIKHIAPFLRASKDKYKKLLEDVVLEDKEREKAIKKLLKKELKDGVQTIRYQLSTLMTTNGQAPFVTIYLEVEEGHEFEEEMALICEEMLRQRIEGMKNEKGQRIIEAFPKLVYLLDTHNCLEGGKYDWLTRLAVESSAKTLAPDYQSAKIIRENYEGHTFPPMGCRSHLSPWRDENNKHKWYGRFNQGVVSLNLPQIAILAEGDMNLFFEILDKRLELCKEALMFRHNLLKGTTSDVSPIHWQHGAIARLKKGEVIDKYLENGYSTLSLGYVGLHEMCMSLIGKSNTSEEGEELSFVVMKYMKSKCDEWKDETGLGFSLYGTPAESLVYRFCRLDKRNFGEIKNITDKLYYTNSYHVNVCEEIDAFSKLLYEAPFHKISSGGCISYIEVEDMTKNLEALGQIINFIYNNVQYAEINTKVDVCYECGYNRMEIDKKDYTWYCPNCGNRDYSKMQVVRRTCGYIGSSFWNKGKTQEIDERVIHI